MAISSFNIMLSSTCSHSHAANTGMCVLVMLKSFFLPLYSLPRTGEVRVKTAAPHPQPQLSLCLERDEHLECIRVRRGEKWGQMRKSKGREKGQKLREGRRRGQRETVTICGHE